MRNLRSWRKFWMLLLIPAVPLLTAGCGGTPTDIDGTPLQFNLAITLQNLDNPALGQPVHLFTPTESFPQGRLDLGQSRTRTMGVLSGETLQFQAGRAGIILTTKDCKCGSACESAKAARVEWNGSVLACKGW